MDRGVGAQSVISDEEIIDLYWNREECAIQETDRKYGRFLYKVAYNILHDSMDCEECKNDTYIGVWNAIPPTRPVAFPAFITQIMRRIAINRYKEKTSKKRVPSELTTSFEDLGGTLHGEPTDLPEYDAAEVGEVINKFVRGLPKRQRYIFIERFYLSESVESIASELSISQATVYREIERIKKDLKRYLERSGIYL